MLRFENVDFRAYRGTALTAFGRADRASFRRDRSDLRAEHISTWFPGNGARPDAQVVAAHGSGNLKTRRFMASGGVRAEQAGQVAVTESARYAADDGLIRGDQPIEVQGTRFTARGPAFTLDPSNQVLHVAGGATVVTGKGVR